ncbi:class I SAM-dependent methyltransferase [Patescibacteria group bacterium]|nr:class I SAM-dependent methyltransferase [Patescibacteria group bacterium]
MKLYYPKNPNRLSARHILADLMNETDKEFVFAEIGVYKGPMVKLLLAYTNIKQYWAIDPWHKLGPEHGRLERITQEEWDSIYLGIAKHMLNSNNLNVLRTTSENAVKIFPDKFFDIVFIDDDHTYQAVKDNIIRWTPKMKHGGWLTGHDYGARRFQVTKAVDEAYGNNVRIYKETMLWLKEIDRD